MCVADRGETGIWLVLGCSEPSPGTVNRESGLIVGDIAALDNSDRMSRVHMIDGMTIEEGTLKLLTVMSFSVNRDLKLASVIRQTAEEISILTEPQNCRDNMGCRDA